MSKVLIIGGHGKVALLASPHLVEAGHEVSGVIRKPEQSGDVSATGATPVVADVEQLSTEQLVELVDGYDTVVWAAGAGGGSPERTFAVDRDAAIRAIDASVSGTPKHFVIVSYFGAGPDHGVPEDNDFYAYAEAKTEADLHLASAGIDATILRPSSLTDQDGSTTIESGAGVSASEVSRGTVAAVIAAVVDAPEKSAGLTLEFNDGDQPIADAIASASA